MKARLHQLPAIVLAVTIIFSSCQKNADGPGDFTTESSVHSDDQFRFSDEVDAVANDINLQIEATSGFTGRGQQVQSLICDATVVVDTVSNPRTITITFNGTNCLGNRTRTGVVVMSMAQGVHWSDAGAVLTVTFQNLQITRLRDNRSITINGTQTHTNVSGGLLINLISLGSITHTITSNNMSITFDNSSQRIWQVARQRTFTYNNGVAIAVTGLHSEGGTMGIAEWGINRFGHTFTTAIAEPIIRRQDCSFRIGSGKVVHTTDLFNASATFGLDANGNPATCPGVGYYYMKIELTGPNGNHTALLPY